MANFIPPLLWALGVLLGMAGIGRVVARAILRTPLPTGIATALGFAITASAGGLANSAQVISRPLILIYVFLGLAALLLDLLSRRAVFRVQARQLAHWLRGDRLFALLLVACILLAAARLAGSIRENSFIAEGQSQGLGFNIHDDFQAYFVFPNKMLETGALGRDPFSERRLLTSLGGSYVWDALVLAQLPEENLHLVDDGLGFLLLLWVTGDLLIALDLPRRRIPLILLLLLTFPQQSINISSSLLPAALFLALVWFYWPRVETTMAWREALVAALFAAGIAAAKSTFIVPLAVFLVAYHVLSAVQAGKPKTRTALLAFIPTVAFTTLLLAPWLVSLYSSFGDPFKLFFGAGVFPGIASPAPSLSVFLRLIVPAILVAAFGIVLRLADLSAVRDRKVRIGSVFLSFLLGWLAALLLLSRTATPSDFSRLAFPFTLAGTAISLCVFAWLLSVLPVGTQMPKIKMQLFAGLVLLFGLIRLPFAIPFYARTLPADIYAGYLDDPLIDRHTLEATRDLQSAALPGATILARLAYPFLLDFQRNPILIVDQPGGYYLPPPADGIPFFQGAERLRQYLRTQHIRYVAWSYASQANFPYADFAARLADPDPHLSHSARCTLDFQSNLEQLRRTCRIVYKDDENALVDLGSN